MASILIKVAGEGLVSKAHRNADVGPTSGSSVVYEVQNVPASVPDEDVIAAFKAFKPADRQYEIDWAALQLFACPATNFSISDSSSAGVCSIG